MSLTLTTYSTNPTCYCSPTGGSVPASGGSIVVVPSGGNAPYVYVWTKNNQFYSNDQNIYALGAGSYTVVVTDSSSPTQLTITRTIVITQPNPILITFTLTGIVCSGRNGTIVANVSGGTGSYTYLWNTGATTSSINVPSGTYSVVITDANGCTATNSIFLPDASKVTVEIEQTLEKCYLESIVLTANPRGGTPPYTVLWSPNGETTLSVGATVDTLFSVTATDANGCTGTTQIYVPNQVEAWQCCLGKLYAAQAQRLINGQQVCDTDKINIAMLAMCINAYTRFARTCLTVQQQQIIIDYINSYCNCSCGQIAAQQQIP